MGERKNLATCKPSEFLAQTNKMRKAVQEWLDVTKVLEIRKNMPALKAIPKDGTQDQINAIKAENRKAVSKQASENLSKIFDAAMEEHPEETLTILALSCFVEPEDVDNYPISFYLANLADILNDKDVLSFFTSLVQLEQTGILNA